MYETTVTHSRFTHTILQYDSRAMGVLHRNAIKDYIFSMCDLDESIRIIKILTATIPEPPVIPNSSMERRV